MSANDLLKLKSRLRKEMLNRLNTQSAVNRSIKSGAITEKLRADPEFKKSATIMFYLSQSFEVDTGVLLRESLRSKRILVPSIDRSRDRLMAVNIENPDEELAAGSYGILEPRGEFAHPFDPEQIDLVLVPGLAFDRQGNRLGRGKGYYDRFLSTLTSRIKFFGLCFDFQLVERVPRDENDIRVHEVITN